MSDYPMLISNKLHSFRNFTLQSYEKPLFIVPFALVFTIFFVKNKRNR